MTQEPRLGCGAAIVQDSRILLIQRLTEPEAQCWGLPGGKVDWLEPVEQAVRREINEELGITLDALSLLCVVDQIDTTNAVHWVAPVYLASGFSGDPQILEPHKHGGLAWFDLAALPERLTTATLVAVSALNNR